MKSRYTILVELMDLFRCADCEGNEYVLYVSTKWVCPLCSGNGLSTKDADNVLEALIEFMYDE